MSWLSKKGKPHGCRTHGYYGTATYSSWASMISRCTNPKSTSWPIYGDKGITVCERWLKFENFLADMGERPAGMSLERKKNEEGYTPENCGWATRAEQSRNRSSCIRLTDGTEVMTLAEWARKFDVPKTTFYRHVTSGSNLHGLTVCN